VRAFCLCTLSIGFPGPFRRLCLCSAKSRFPTAETGVGHGLWFHDPGDIEQIGPNPRHPYQQRPVTAVQPQTSRRLPQCDVELMAYKEVLGSETPSRLEYVADKRREQVQDGNHRI
jgi:hypothetical protein